MKYCVYCRTKLADDMTFCTKCGRKQPMLEKKQPELKKKPRRTTAEKLVVPVVIAAGVISLLAIAAMVIYGFIKPDWAYPSKDNDQNAATGIMLSCSRKYLEPDESTTLSVDALPIGCELTDITWSSSDESIAKVSRGRVTALELGEADIFAEDEYGNTAKCRIIVADSVTVSPLSDFGDMDERLVSVSGTKPNSANESFASGYIMDNGKILTASNVADNEENLVITMPDGTNEAARLISNDVKSNVAMLEIVDRVDLDKGEIEDIPAETGFASSLSLPKAGDVMYLIGYEDAYSAEPVIREIFYREMVEQDGELILLTDSSGHALMGAIVVDADGSLYGVNMMDNTHDELSLVLTATSLDKIVRKQIKKINEDSNPVQSIPKDGRSNLYLDAASNYGWDTSDIARQYDSDSWWSADAMSGPYYFMINQSKSDLIRLRFDSAAAVEQPDFWFGEDRTSVATAYTDKGEYSYSLNRHKLEYGDFGEILLYFEGLEGELEEIIIDNVSTEDGILEFDFTGNNGRKETAPEVPAETVTETTAAPETPRVRAAKAYLELLDMIETDYYAIEDITGEAPGYVFNDINGDSIPEMVFSRIVDEAGRASTPAVMSFDYNRIIQYQIATYDDNADQVIPLLNDYNIVINDQDDYLQTLAGRRYFYCFNGDDHFYVYYAGNISGAAFNLTEYEIDTQTGVYEISNAFTSNWGNEYSVTGTPGMNMERLLSDKNNAANPTAYMDDCYLFYSYRYESDLPMYTHEGAKDYLRNIINGG